MNKCQTNNNPLNLRFANQRESTGADDTGFAIFPNAPSGWRAAVRQITLDQGRGLTVRQFLFKFAPPSENDTMNYLKFILKELSIYGDDLLETVSPYALCGVMARMEGYFND